MANDSSSDTLPHQVLPIPDRAPVGLTPSDAKDPDTRFTPNEQPRPPDGAPNVLGVLIGGVGFGALSAFGGPVDTPTAERLAANTNGLNCSRFHTTHRKINWVELDVDQAALAQDHILTGAERFHMTLAFQ